MRYVERNPVRAGIELRADDSRWSNAAAHCGTRLDALLNPESGWSKQFSVMEDWSAWLSERDEADEIHRLWRNVEKELPCGSAGFVEKPGRRAGRLREYRPQARPEKANDEK